MHALLTELTIEHVFVRILQLSLVNALLLHLLGGLNAPCLFSMPVNLLNSVLFLLLANCEVLHVLRVDMCLLV